MEITKEELQKIINNALKDEARRKLAIEAGMVAIEASIKKKSGKVKRNASGKVKRNAKGR